MAKVKAKGFVDAIYFNYGTLFRDHFAIALINWRAGRDDRLPYNMQQTMAVIDEILGEHDKWQPEPHDLDGIMWPIVKIAGYLANHPVDFTYDSPELKDNEDLALVQRVVDALYDRPYKDGLEQALAKFGGVKRRKLAYNTFVNYFDLLECDPASEQADFLAKRGELLWTKRRKDAYFCGGDIMEGGQEFNDEYVDYVLGAVLKKIGWQGDSIHKWRWG